MKVFCMPLAVGLLLFPGFVFSQNPDSLAATKAVDSLIKASQAITGNRDFVKALEINEAAEKLALEKLGRESAAYGSCCLNHGRIHHIKRAFPDAEKWYIEAMHIREKVLGKGHSDYARCLNNLGALYKDMGDFRKAENYFMDAMAIWEKALGKEDPIYAQSLVNVANFYADIGKYKEAEPLYLEALSIQEKAGGKEHSDYAPTLNVLGLLYADMGKYEEGETLYLQARAILEKTTGRAHTKFAECQNNLAILYSKTGRYEKAAACFLDASSIFEKTRGTAHPFYMGSLVNLGIVYKNMGDYKKAEQYYLKSKEVNEKVRGKEHLAYARSLVGLANLYGHIGNSDKAEPLLLQALSIYEKSFGKEHPDYVTSLAALGAFYMQQKNFEKAEPILLEVKGCREKSTGKENQDYIISLANLGVLYLNMKNYEKAASCFLETKPIQESILGKEHPEYAMNLNNMGLLYALTGDKPRAEQCFLEALAIKEKVLGKEHADYSETLFNLSSFYENQGRFAESTPLFEEVFALNQSLLSEAATFLSEQELNDYLVSFQLRVDAISNYLKIRPAGQKGVLPSLVYDYELFQKGFLLTTANQLNILAASSPATFELNDKLKGYHRILAAEYVKPVAKRTGITELEAKAEAIEKELARMITGFAEARKQVKWQDVQTALRQDEAAIEFLQFSIEDTDSILYGALVLRAGVGQPQFVPLFEAQKLDSLLRVADPADATNHLYATRGISPANRQIPPLYNLIWRPIDSLLQGVKTIWYSPAGLLHRVAFNAIPTGSGNAVLGDRYELFQLFSTRNLVAPAHSEASTLPTAAVLFGGIQYDFASKKIDGMPEKADSSLALAFPENEWLPETRRYRKEGVGELPATKTEVIQLGKLLANKQIAVNLLTDTLATEERFKGLGKTGMSPAIIHLATHGFFFPDSKKKSDGQAASEAGANFRMAVNPLLRSGLLLAGANEAWITGQPPRNREDGILTGYEIAQVNLSGTKLAVLSACETGLGDLVGAEGAFGLQRAFKMAGVDKLIVSLWPVPDKETALFMESFYKNWLGGLPMRTAFYQTQKEMRRKFADPFKWAAFILIE